MAPRHAAPGNSCTHRSGLCEAVQCLWLSREERRPHEHPQHQSPVPGSCPGKEEHPPRLLRGRGQGLLGAELLSVSHHPQCEPLAGEEAERPMMQLPGLALTSDS